MKPLSARQIHEKNIKSSIKSGKYFENMNAYKAFIFFHEADKLKKLPDAGEMALKAVRLHPAAALINFSKYENKKWAKKIAEIALKLKPRLLGEFIKRNHKSKLAKRIVLETLPLVKQDKLMNAYRNLLDTNAAEYVEYIKKEVRENKKIALILMTSIRYFAKKQWARGIIIAAIPNAANVIVLQLKYFKDQGYVYEVLMRISDQTKNNNIEHILKYCANKEWAYTLLKKEMKKNPREMIYGLIYYKDKPWAPILVMDTIDYALQNDLSISLLSILYAVKNKPWLKDVLELFLKHFPNEIIYNIGRLKKIKGIDKIAMKVVQKNPKNVPIAIADFAFLPNFEEIALYLLVKNPAELIYNILNSKKIKAGSKLVIMTEAMKNFETTFTDENSPYFNHSINSTFKAFLNESTFKSLRTENNLSKLISKDSNVLFTGLDKLAKSYPELTMKLLRNTGDQLNNHSLSEKQTSKLKKLTKLKSFQQYSTELIGLFLNIAPKILPELLETHKNPGEILQQISNNIDKIANFAHVGWIIKKIYKVNGYNEIKLGITLRLCEIDAILVLGEIDLIKERDPQSLAKIIAKLKKNIKFTTINNRHTFQIIEENKELFGEEFINKLKEQRDSVNKAASDIVSKNKQPLKKDLKLIKYLYSLYINRDKRFKKTLALLDNIKIPIGADVGKFLKSKLASAKKSVESREKELLKDPALAFVHQIDSQWIKELHVPLIAFQNQNEFLFHIARNLWTNKKEITKENVEKEALAIYKNLTKYADKPIFKDRNIVFLAHNEKDNDGTNRFGKKAILEAIKRQGGKLGEKDFLRAKNTLKSLKTKKQAFLNFIENKSGPITAVLDAHGGENAIYLSNGEIKNGKIFITSNTVKITYKEIAKRLIERKKKFENEDDDVLFIFESCYSSTMIRKIYSEVKKLGGSRFIAIGTSEYNQYSYSTTNNKFGSKYFDKAMRLNSAGKKNPTTFEDLFKTNKTRNMSSNLSIFIPSEEGEFRQIAEKQKETKPDQFAA